MTGIDTKKETDRQETSREGSQQSRDAQGAGGSVLIFPSGLRRHSGLGCMLWITSKSLRGPRVRIRIGVQGIAKNFKYNPPPGATSVPATYPLITFPKGQRRALCFFPSMFDLGALSHVNPLAHTHAF